MTLKLPAFGWHHGWNVIVISLLFQSLCIGTSFYCFTLWVVPWSNEFGVARSQIIFAIAASQVIGGLVSPLGGHALDRLPPQWVVCCGGVIFALGLLLMACTQAIWQLVAVFLALLPIGLVLTGTMAAQTLATRWFTKDRGFAIACATLGSSLGGFSMPPIAAALTGAFGWRITIAVFALTIALLSAVAWRILKREPPIDGHTNTETASVITHDAAPQYRAWRTLDLLRDRHFRLIILTFLPLLLAFSAVQMNLGAYAQDLGLTQQDAAFLVAQFSLCSLIGRVIFGKLIDRYAATSLYRIVTVGLIISLAIVIGAASFNGAMSRNMLTMGIALLGLSSAGYVPLNSTFIIAQFGTRSFGQVMGMSNIFLGLGTAGSYIAASLRDMTGSYPFAFIIFLFLLIPGISLIRRLQKQTHPSHQLAAISTDTE